MQITKTVKLKILSHTKVFDKTIELYNKALSFYIAVCDKEYEYLRQLKTSKERLNYIESITHRTSKHTKIKYDFDKDFYKFPSYLRRAAIMKALGVCDSYRSNLDRWIKERDKAISKERKFYKKPPTLNLNHKSFPTLYKSNMFHKLKDGIAKIKIFKDNDWRWLEIRYSTKNLKSSNKIRFDKNLFKDKNPTLIKKAIL